MSTKKRPEEIVFNPPLTAQDIQNAAVQFRDEMRKGLPDHAFATIELVDEILADPDSTLARFIRSAVKNADNMEITMMAIALSGIRMGQLSKTARLASDVPRETGPLQFPTAKETAAALLAVKPLIGKETALRKTTGDFLESANTPGVALVGVLLALVYPEYVTKGGVETLLDNMLKKVSESRDMVPQTVACALAVGTALGLKVAELRGATAPAEPVEAAPERRGGWK